MRKAVVLLLVVALFAGVLGSTPARAAEAVVVQMTVGSTKGTINMQPVVLDQAPLIENGRTLVPFRFIGEALGAQIGWNPANKTVSYVLGKINIVLTIGSTTATVNGVKKTLDVAPKILPTGRTVVPIRFVSENIGAKVEWNATTRMVTVTMAAVAVVFSGQIKIGLSVSVTGPAPLQGQRSQQGIQIAMDEINAKGGVLGKKLVPYVVDDQGTVPGALLAVAKLVSDPTIVAVMGPFSSSDVLAVSDLYKNAKVPFFTGATSPRLETLGNPYAFFGRPSDGLTAKGAVIYLHEVLGYKNIGISFNNNDHGNDAKKVIEKYCTDNKVAFVEAGHNPGDKDMTGQIVKLKNAKVDCVIMWSDDVETETFARQAYELNLNVPILDSQTITNSIVLAAVDAKWVENWYSATDFISNSTAPTAQAFEQKMQSKFHVASDVYSACYYGCMLALADAITRAGSTDHEAVRNAISTTKGIPGIIGDYTCDSINHLAHSAMIVQINNKVAKLLKVVSVNP
jgi:branched-chain amino acid transport system substrate-binding protein